MTTRVGKTRHVGRWIGSALGLVVAFLGLVAGAQATASDPVLEFSSYTDSSVNIPREIVAGPDGALWFTNFGDPPTIPGEGSIGRITTEGSISYFYDWPKTMAPRGITAGPDGALWFTSYYGQSIGRVSTAGTITSYPDPRIIRPWGITEGPDGALWFTDRYRNSIGRITTTGELSFYSHSSIRAPLGITVGPDGALWFANVDNQSIGRITTSGEVTNFPTTVPEFILYPTDLTAGPDGALWFTSGTRPGRVGRLTTSGELTVYAAEGIEFPSGITRGPDGALWFANGLLPSIGRITTNGEVSIFTHESVRGPDGIALGPDGALWYTNPSYQSIGRLKIKGAPDLISDLVARVQSYNLETLGSSLTAKLDNAQRLLEADKTKTGPACNLLDAFLNEVEAQASKGLTDEQATELIAAAEQIQGVIGCEP